MKYNVLVADDNPEIQTYFSKYSNWFEYEMQLEKIASTGVEAIDFFRKNKVDIAIIDLKLKGINGLEVIEEINRLGLKTYLIVMGGYKSKKFIEEAMANGARDVVYKNIDEKALNGALLKGYCFLEGHNEKRAGLPCKAMGLMEVIEERSKELLPEVDKKFLAVMETAKSSEQAHGEIFSKFWKEFWLVARKRYGWLENIFNFYRYENFDWEALNEKETELEFTNTAIRFGELVRRFDVCQEDGRVREICASIIREVENGVRLSLIAKEMNYSKNHICTLFKQKTGREFYRICQYGEN